MRKWPLIAMALAVALAQGKESLSSLTEWPVADGQILSPGDYKEASALAAGGAAPLDIALRIVGPFEGVTQHIVQSNHGGEAAVRSTVIVIRDGLLDDSVRGERWDISLERSAVGWSIKQVKRTWTCWRGNDRFRFGSARCP